MTVINTDLLTKSFGDFKAVDQVSLSVDQGEIYGFLGLNGAGKTTTMRMLLGMIRPSSGELSLLGQPVRKTSPIWKKVGYMIETTQAYPNLTVEDYLKVFSQYYGLKGKHSINRVIELLSLEKYRNVKSINLSLGNLQRLGLARALMHEPELLILDEPVNGLDPAGIVEIRQLLNHLSEEGITIMISSHLLSEIAKIADKVGIIHNGQLIRELEVTDLGNELEHKLILDTTDNKQALTLLMKVYREGQVNADNLIELTSKMAVESPESVARMLVMKNIPPKQMVRFTEDLESYFFRILHKHSPKPSP